MLERLQKIIAHAGIASRRHAEQLILSGQVRVNGVVVTELGSKADSASDRIEAAGRVVRAPEKRTYLMLNKPPQVVSTLADPEGRPTIQHYLRGLPTRVFPVGRLDYDASGLILLTDDGELANRMFHASARLEQTYFVKVKGRLSEDEMRSIGAETRARVRSLKAPHAARGLAGQRRGPSTSAWYEISFREARRDVLRQALAAAGHPVEKMKRVRLGTLELADLPEGRYRELAPGEVAALERAVSQPETRRQTLAPKVKRTRRGGHPKRVRGRFRRRGKSS